MSISGGFSGIRSSFGKETRYQLDRMTLGELTLAYFRYRAIQVYLVLLVASVMFACFWGGTGLDRRVLYSGLAAALTWLAYPVFWYLIHRFVLHSRTLYRSPRTAALWKRIHYDHHRDPHDLRVLFGALHTTLPTIAALTTPIGVAVGGAVGGAAAFGAGLASTLFYEYCHCIQHLRYSPRSRFLRRIKRLHLLHHFHNEQVNFGITNYLWDRFLGTYSARAGTMPRSPTVFNLGYCGDEQVRYPWVARLSGRQA
jgi:sterol desaturase/sphingolipid hydroxylase (fatty acid hydroxylase superfamily)